MTLTGGNITLRVKGNFVLKDDNVDVLDSDGTLSYWGKYCSWKSYSGAFAGQFQNRSFVINVETFLDPKKTGLMDFQSEVVNIFVTIGHPLQPFDLVIDSL